MAVQAPDPKSFTTWEDAFQYPVPVVRRLEQQLRGNIHENREKLRTLVGASYRDLLGTAERIIEMNDRMEQTEAHLADIGQKCNARSVERIAANHASMIKMQRERSSSHRAFGSELALLQSCMTVASRIIKERQSCSTAAKLLVLARLLHNSASKAADNAPLLDTLRQKLAGLRRRLLKFIDNRLADVTASIADVVESLLAYSLATSSTPTAILRHFLHVRSQALNDFAESLDDSKIETAMDLIVLTMQHAHTAFPRRVAESLAQLKDQPLLADPKIRLISQLNLDVCERWISEDVRRFTPWPRHDELQTSQATQILQPWAVTARQSVIKGIRRYLVADADAKRVTATRQHCLQYLLSSTRASAGLDKSAFLTELRTCFNSRLVEILGQQSNAIVESLNSALAQNNDRLFNATNLWDSTLQDIDLGRGAVAFRSQTLARSLGKDAALQSLTDSLDGWQRRMNALSEVIKGMRNARWDDDLDMDSEDYADIDSVQDLLGRQDPDMLSQQFDKDAAQAFSHALSTIRTTVLSLKTCSDGGTRAMFLLRVMREVSQRRSSAQAVETMSTETELLSELHGILVDQVVTISSKSRSPPSPGTIPFSRPPPTTLWEGLPPLPIQPSPVCFRFVHEVCSAMKASGADLWTRSAVDCLKNRLHGIIIASITSLIEGNISPPYNHTQVNAEVDAIMTNGNDHDSVAGPSADETPSDHGTTTHTEISPGNKDKLIQALYDLLYLERLLTPSSGNVLILHQITDQVIATAEVADTTMERLQKSAADYHRRTYLLFGILSPT